MQMISGELGYELFHNRAESLKLYDAIMRKGQRYGITNLGINTLNTLRMEKGFKIWGREVSAINQYLLHNCIMFVFQFSFNHNPIQTGLEMLLDMDVSNCFFTL